MALKNTDRVSTARVAAGDVLLTWDGAGRDGLTPSTTLTGATWRTVESSAVVALGTNSTPGYAGRRSSPRRYVVRFTDGTSSAPVAGVQHWTRQAHGWAATAPTVALADIVADVSAAFVASRPDPIVAPPAPREDTSHLHTTDDATPYDGGDDADADGERCSTCRGFGLVRATGPRVGQRYRTLVGAQASQEAGRAADCPTCDGLGLVGLYDPAELATV